MDINTTFEKTGKMPLHGFEKACCETTQSTMQEKTTTGEPVAHLIDAGFGDWYNKMFIPD